MGDLWDTIKDRWEWDSFFREQIILAVLVGAIGLTFTLIEVYAKASIDGRG